MSKHNPLVSRATIDHGVVDFGALGVDYVSDFGGVVVESHCIVVVANAIEHFFGDGGVIHFRGGGHFAGNEQQPGGDEAFASHFGVGVLGEIRIEDGIRNLVSDFVGVAGRNRLTGELIDLFCHDM